MITILNDKCKWTEEKIIDFILGESKDSIKEKEFIDHLPDCRQCQDLYERWRPLLSNNIEERPKEALSLRGKIYRTLLIIISRRRTIGKPLLIVSFVGVLLISGFLLGRMTMPPLSVPSSPLALSDVSSEQETNGQALPTSYKVLSIHHKKMDGYVWLNRETKDIMVFLNGLHPLKGKDYQAWIVSNNNDKQVGGLLQISEGVGHVYVHKAGVKNVSKLIISVEPQGGSAIQTGPETVNLDLSEVDQF